MMARILLATIVLGTLTASGATADGGPLSGVDFEGPPLLDPVMDGLPDDADVIGAYEAVSKRTGSGLETIVVQEEILTTQVLSYVPGTPKIGGDGVLGVQMWATFCQNMGSIPSTDGVNVYDVSFRPPYGATIVTPSLGTNQKTWAYCP